MISESLLLLECHHKEIKSNTMTSMFYKCRKCDTLRLVVKQYYLNCNGGYYVV